MPHDADPACRRRRGFRVRRGSWRIPRGWIAPLAAALAGATPLLAQNQEPVVEVVFENDALIGVVPGVPNSDREYTHGLAVAVDVRGAPLWGRAFPKLRPCTTPVPGRFACARTRFEGGQKIFTPDYKRRFESPQRPYAAWLYGAVTGRAVSASLDRSLRVELGVTGPPAMGELFQSVVHKIIQYPVPDGWDRQLAFEPGLLLRYREERLFELRSDEGSRVADLVPSWQVTLGNVRTGAQVGLAGRVGSNLAHPWSEPTSTPDLEVAAFAAVRQNWTLRDLFLDGNTFRDSQRVEKLPFTTSGEIGVLLDFDRYRLAYSLVMEERLYTTQPRPHRYVKVVLTRGR